ncbi:MAG: hypothetical protein WD669_10160 [Pirellulales bacterium]
MALRDPVAIYNAATNLEAALVCEILDAAGVEAYAIEDVSPAGQWMFGLLPEIHKPQVWIERAEMPKAKPILEKYESNRDGTKVDGSNVGSIVVSCEDCGQQSEFPASRVGFVETCSHCGAYVDVGDSAADGWEELNDEETGG